MNIKFLPQQYPFQLIDEVITYKPNEYLLALKNITSSEWTFDQRDATLSHYPETLMIESAAQLGVLFFKMNQDAVRAGGQDKKIFLGKVKAEFFDQVFPGDQIKLELLSSRMLASGGIFNVNILKDKQKIAEVELFCSIR